MKKFCILTIFVYMLILVGCEGTSISDNNDENIGEASVTSETNEINETSESEKKQEGQKATTLLSKEEFEKMFSDPKNFKGSLVDFYAKVFVEPERDNEGTYLQAFANNNDGYNTIIMINDSELDVAAEDIIHVKGSVHDEFKGENAFGGQVIAPAILADTIVKSDYQTAFAPAKEVIEVNEEQIQHGYKLNVEKVELSENETRIYVKVENDSTDKINFYSFNAKMIADGKQYEEEFNYDANYPEVQSEILPGVNSEGIITFPKLSEDIETFQLYFEGSSDNWELDFEPFVFDIKK